MAIYHCSLKVFSRSSGHSAVAAAAYRSGSKLFDERTGKLHHYENRKGVLDTFLLLPENTHTTYTDRAYLWNAAEHADNRKNSRTARELVLALPHELSDADRQALTRDMAGWLMERYRVAVDAAIHKPIDEHGDDPRNHHAHILFSTRVLGEGGFGAKTRVLDDRKTGAEETELIREVWEVLANDALKSAGHSDALIDRRSLEDQGIDRIPEIHEGTNATHAGEALNGSESQVNASEAKDHKSSSKEEQGKPNEVSEEEEGDDDQGDTTAGGGSGESGGLAPSLDVKPSDVVESLDPLTSENSAYEYKAVEMLTRRDLNTEIKRINALRVTLSDVPLIDQINDLDHLLERLDTRVGRLERLVEASSLPNKLQKTMTRSIKRLVALSQELITSRDATQTTLALNAQEKQARESRQNKRYGRTYRRGVHTQMREMKQHLSILQSKQIDYQNYKTLVDSIDREISLTPTISNNGSSHRQTTTKEHLLKINLQASHIRQTIPEEFRAPSKAERTSLKINTENTKIYIRNGKSETVDETDRIIKNHPTVNSLLSAQVKVKTEVNSNGRQVNARTNTTSSFTKAVSVNKEVLSQNNPPWRIPPKDGVVSFNLKLATKPTNISQYSAAIKPERRPWVSHNKGKMDLLVASIEKKQAETRRERGVETSEYVEYNRETPVGQFNAKNDPKHHIRTTREAQRVKSSAEAEVIRERVPEEFRARPYPPRDTSPVNSGFCRKV